MSIRIVADSSCDLPVSFVTDKGVDFATVPLKIRVGELEFVDDAQLDVSKMLAAMKASKAPSSTACPSPEEFAAQFRQADEVYAVTISSKLSGTYNSACIAREMVLEECPHKKIHVLDSLSTSSAMGLLILRLMGYIRAGKLDFDAVVERVEHYRKTLSTRFLIQSFDNLIKAGRMSRITGTVAQVLSIRPICGDNGRGEIKIFEKVRGSKTAMTRLVEMMADKASPDGKPIFITHCNNPGDAEFLRDVACRLYKPSDVRLFEMRGLAAYYAGDKGVILAY